MRAGTTAVILGILKMQAPNLCHHFLAMVFLHVLWTSLRAVIHIFKTGTKFYCSQLPFWRA